MYLKVNYVQCVRVSIVISTELKLQFVRVSIVISTELIRQCVRVSIVISPKLTLAQGDRFAFELRFYEYACNTSITVQSITVHVPSISTGLTVNF